MNDTQRNIIAVCGYKGSGKSEVARHLIKQHGYTRYPFALRLKAMLRTLGLTPDQVGGLDKETPDYELLGGKTPRHAMQTLGTQWGRECMDEHLWARAWATHLPQDKNIVCDDLRFYNEAKVLLDHGAVLWRVDRPGHGPPHPWWRKLLRLGPKVHASERYVHDMPIHAIVRNTTSIEDLHKRIDETLLPFLYVHKAKYDEDIRSELNAKLR